LLLKTYKGTANGMKIN